MQLPDVADPLPPRRRRRLHAGARTVRRSSGVHGARITRRADRRRRPLPAVRATGSRRRTDRRLRGGLTLNRAAPASRRRARRPGRRDTSESATRRARSWSSGQPADAGQCRPRADAGVAPQRVDQPAPALPIGSLEPRLPTGHARRASAGSGSATAARAARRTTTERDSRPQAGARLVHTVAPRSSSPWFHAQPRRRARPRRPAPCTSRAGERPARANGRQPGHVRVDDRHVVLEGEDQHGPSGVRPDAGQREQLVEVAGTTPPCWSTIAHGAAVQVERAPVVAEAGPAASRPRRPARPRTPPASGTARGTRGTCGTTRATCVCWSISSETSTAHGSRVRRHGRSRRDASAHASKRASASAIRSGSTRRRASCTGTRSSRAPPGPGGCGRTRARGRAPRPARPRATHRRR